MKDFHIAHPVVRSAVGRWWNSFAWMTPGMMCWDESPALPAPTPKRNERKDSVNAIQIAARPIDTL